MWVGLIIITFRESALIEMRNIWSIFLSPPPWPCGSVIWICHVGTVPEEDTKIWIHVLIATRIWQQWKNITPPSANSWLIMIWDMPCTEKLVDLNRMKENRPGCPNLLGPFGTSANWRNCCGHFAPFVTNHTLQSVRLDTIGCVGMGVVGVPGKACMGTHTGNHWRRMQGNKFITEK